MTGHNKKKEKIVSLFHVKQPGNFVQRTRKAAGEENFQAQPAPGKKVDGNPISRIRKPVIQKGAVRCHRIPGRRDAAAGKNREITGGAGREKAAEYLWIQLAPGTPSKMRSILPSDRSAGQFYLRMNFG